MPQLSARVALHSTHAPPGLPHCGNAGVTHVLPEQHPDGHDVESQTHVIPRQRWPAPHGKPAPHLQAPLVHLSEDVELQATQLMPLTPQAVNAEGVLQVLPLQQPSEHEVESHTQVVPLQRCPGAQLAPLPHWQLPFVHAFARTGSHAMQVAPAVAQVPVDCALQVEPVQHPEGHEVESQTQALLTQR